MSPLVETRSVSKSYERGNETVRALRDVNIELDAGELVALIGPSGSGKSTLLNLLARWETPDGGTIRWAGSSEGPPIVWRAVAVVPQKLGLIAELSVEENIELPMRLESSAPNIAIDPLIQQLGLEKLRMRQPNEISVGEQQRTALARALVLSPKLLLLDEPTGHQDGAWAATVFELLRGAARIGSCILVATHNPEVLPYCDRVLEIRDGSIH